MRDDTGVLAQTACATKLLQGPPATAPLAAIIRKQPAMAREYARRRGAPRRAAARCRRCVRFARSPRMRWRSGGYTASPAVAEMQEGVVKA